MSWLSKRTPLLKRNEERKGVVELDLHFKRHMLQTNCTLAALGIIGRREIPPTHFESPSEASSLRLSGENSELQ